MNLGKDERILILLSPTISQAKKQYTYISQALSAPSLARESKLDVSFESSPHTNLEIFDSMTLSALILHLFIFLINPMMYEIALSTDMLLVFL
jgi:hypothetical protein